MSQYKPQSFGLKLNKCSWRKKLEPFPECISCEPKISKKKKGFNGFFEEKLQ